MSNEIKQQKLSVHSRYASMDNNLAQAFIINNDQPISIVASYFSTTYPQGFRTLFTANPQNSGYTSKINHNI
jgi:hypothetical protein